MSGVRNLRRVLLQHDMSGRLELLDVFDAFIVVIVGWKQYKRPYKGSLGLCATYLRQLLCVQIEPNFRNEQGLTKPTD